MPSSTDSAPSPIGSPSASLASTSEPKTHPIPGPTNPNRPPTNPPVGHASACQATALTARVVRKLVDLQSQTQSEDTRCPSGCDRTGAWGGRRLKPRPLRIAFHNLAVYAVDHLQSPMGGLVLGSVPSGNVAGEEHRAHASFPHPHQVRMSGRGPRAKIHATRSAHRDILVGVNEDGRAVHFLHLGLAGLPALRESQGPERRHPDHQSWNTHRAAIAPAASAVPVDRADSQQGSHVPPWKKTSSGAGISWRSLGRVEVELVRPSTSNRPESLPHRRRGPRDELNGFSLRFLRGLCVEYSGRSEVEPR